MGSDSPNGLSMDDGIVLHKLPFVSRMSKSPAVLIGLAIFMLLAVVIYSVSFSGKGERKQEEKPQNAQAQQDKAVWDMEGSGLASPPKDAQKSGLSGTEPKKPQANGDGALSINVQHNKLPDPDPILENARRVRSQAYMSALSSPMLVKRNNAQERPADSDHAERHAPASQRNTGGTKPLPQNADYDSSADRDKEQFLERASRSQWALGEVRTAGQRYELKTGTVIPGVMVTGVNSDLPGNLIAQVSQNVWDSATGRYLLIPQGTKIYGVYDSRIVYGQERCLIAWNRLIFPDGSSISLGAMPGADMAGFAGFHDRVNNHYLRIFGSALMMSLVSGGMAYALDSTNANSDTTKNGTSMTDEMTSAFASQLGQATTNLLQKNLSIKPTLEIRPGYQFNIVCTKDIAFTSPYASWGRR